MWETRLGERGPAQIHQPNRLLGPGVEAGRWVGSSIAETIHGGGALCGDSNRFDLGLGEERGRIKGPFTHSFIDPEDQAGTEPEIATHTHTEREREQSRAEQRVVRAPPAEKTCRPEGRRESCWWWLWLWW